MIIPPFLKQGDTVGIVCTARKFSAEEAQSAITLLESWGLQVKLGFTIGLNSHQLGGSDQQRADDFQDMLNDDKVKMIWCARGGYGTVRMIDLVDFSGITKCPKWIVGFSDVTVLHAHLNRLGVATIHAIMPFSVTRTEAVSIDYFKNAIFGNQVSYVFSSSEYNKYGIAEGELVGGNLSIIYALLGSPSSIQTKGKILFIEDLDEYLYHIDRMLMNVKRNGLFKDLAGLIVGGMTDMHDNEIPFGMNAQQIILDLTAEYDFPIIFDFPAGHVPDNRALLFGKSIKMNVQSQQVEVFYQE